MGVYLLRLKYQFEFNYSRFLFLKRASFKTEKKAISSSEMHTSLAPISHAIEVGDMVYISGKIGFTKEGKLAGGGLCGEVHQAMKNFESVLTAAGCTFDNGKCFTIHFHDSFDVFGAYKIISFFIVGVRGHFINIDNELDLIH